MQLTYIPLLLSYLLVFVSSPERGPVRTLSLDDEVPHDGGEATGCANEDNCDSHHNVESLLSRLQIDKSLPAVLVS